MKHLHQVKKNDKSIIGIYTVTTLKTDLLLNILLKAGAIEQSCITETIINNFDNLTIPLIINLKKVKEFSKVPFKVEFEFSLENNTIQTELCKKIADKPQTSSQTSNDNMGLASANISDFSKEQKNIDSSIEQELTKLLISSKNRPGYNVKKMLKYDNLNNKGIFRNIEGNWSLSSRDERSLKLNFKENSAGSLNAASFIENLNVKVLLLLNVELSYNDNTISNNDNKPSNDDDITIINSIGVPTSIELDIEVKEQTFNSMKIFGEANINKLNELSFIITSENYIITRDKSSISFSPDRRATVDRLLTPANDIWILKPAGQDVLNNETLRFCPQSIKHLTKSTKEVDRNTTDDRASKDIKVTYESTSFSLSAESFVSISFNDMVTRNESEAYTMDQLNFNFSNELKKSIEYVTGSRTYDKTGKKQIPNNMEDSIFEEIVNNMISDLCITGANNNTTYDYNYLNGLLLGEITDKVNSTSCAIIEGIEKQNNILNLITPVLSNDKNAINYAKNHIDILKKNFIHTTSEAQIELVNNITELIENNQATTSEDKNNQATAPATPENNNGQATTPSTTPENNNGQATTPVNPAEDFAKELVDSLKSFI